MKIVARHATGKTLKRDNLQIGAEAKVARLSDPSAIDATTGIFYYDNYHFQGFRVVDKILKNLKDEDIYTYSSSDGGKEFQDAVLNWVFGESLEEVKSQSALKVISTPGGTGAIYNSIFNSLDQGESLLIPDLHWGPYTGMANNLGYKPKYFQLFSGDSFNYEGFKEAAESIIKEQGKLVTVINDPCNNPTGYTLTNQELDAIISFLNEKNVPSVLIYDIAYFDFSTSDRLSKIKILNKIGKQTLVSICFSASKTFSVYGQRLGAEIIMGKDEAEVQDFSNACNFTARNTWSNVNKALINLMITLNKNKELRDQHFEELKEVKRIIKERAKIFLEEAASINLRTHPYTDGFFISIPTANNNLVLDALVHEENAYLLPNLNAIRVAICSVPASDLKGLALKIKRIIDKFN